MTKAIASQLAPKQLGVSTPLGCEGAMHAARDFVERPPQSNAFN